MTNSYSVAPWALKSRHSLRSLLTLKKKRITNMIMGLQEIKCIFGQQLRNEVRLYSIG